MIRSQIIIFLLLLAALQSCLTVRQIERNCDKFAKICLETTRTDTVIIHDSTTITKRDTIIEFRIERDTVFNAVFLPSIERSLTSDTSRLSTGLAFSEAFIYNSRLYHTLESGDTILNIRLNNALTEITRLKKEIRASETTNTVTVRKDTQFGKFCKRWFFGTLILIVLFVAFKIWGSKLTGLF